jgi:transcriptional regulator with XRE-family HTH domain
MTIGDRIRERRIELGLSQQELAEKLGYRSKVSVSHAENDRDDMTTTRIQKYADALDVTPGYLMGWTRESFDIDNGIHDYNEHLQNIYSYFGYEEHYIVEVYDKLSSKGRKEMLTLISNLQKKYCITTTPEEKLEEILMDNAGL